MAVTIFKSVSLRSRTEGASITQNCPIRAYQTFPAGLATYSLTAEVGQRATDRLFITQGLGDSVYAYM